MAKSPKKALSLPRFSAVAIAAVVFALCIIFPATAADDDSSSSSALRLPSQSSAAGEVRHNDPCAGTTPSSCPVNCFQPDPVCGVDGVTYWCGCPDAACAGVAVAKLGFCEVGNGGSAPLPGQALLLVHIVWLIVLGFSVLFGLF